MTVTTKFNDGDKIFFLRDQKVLVTTVRGFIIEKRPKSTEPTITYLCHEGEDEKQVHLKILETSAFPSKEALIKSL